jgi:hypothetical protein
MPKGKKKAQENVVIEKEVLAELESKTKVLVDSTRLHKLFILGKEFIVEDSWGHELFRGNEYDGKKLLNELKRFA